MPTAKKVTSSSTTAKTQSATPKTVTKSVTQELAKPVSQVTSTAKGNPVMGSFADRFVAFLLDALLLGVLLMVGYVALVIFFGILFAIFGDSDAVMMTLSGLSVIFWIAYFTLGYTFYFYYFYKKSGATPGKKVMQLKVVKTKDFRYLTFWETFLREVIGKRFISQFFFYLGYFWYYMSEKRQAWQDMLASTYVVKTDEKGTILMSGPAEYKQEPVKTFVPLGCMFVATVILMMAIFGVIAGAMGLASQSLEYQDGMQDLRYDMDNNNLKDTDANLNYQFDYNGETGPQESGSETPMTPEEYQQYQDQIDQLLQQMNVEFEGSPTGSGEKQ